EKDFTVPLGILGRRAQTSFIWQCKKKLSHNYREKFSKRTAQNKFLDYSFIQALGHSSSAPTWAVHNPYVSFPNFISDSLDSWPTPSSDREERALSMKMWKLGRGEFGGEDEYSRRMDLAQWRQASIDHERDQTESYDCEAY